MLEIILIIWLCKKVGRITRAKRQRPLRYQFMMISLVLGGELCGGFVGALIGSSGTREGITAPVYLCALLGAFVGVAIGLSIVNGLPDARVAPRGARGFEISPIPAPLPPITGSSSQPDQPEAQQQPL